MKWHRKNNFPEQFSPADAVPGGIAEAGISLFARGKESVICYPFQQVMRQAWRDCFSAGGSSQNI